MSTQSLDGVVAVAAIVPILLLPVLPVAVEE
jgi:hypothetical protein